MASIAELAVMITADASQYSRELNSTLGKTQSWASNIGGVASAALGGVVLGAATAVVVGMAAIGGAALNVSRDTEQAAAAMAASLDVPAERAAEFAKVAQQVYGNNFAGSVVEAGEVVAEAYRRMGDVGDEQLQRITEQAFALADNFDTGPTEAISAAQTLMDNFGVSSDEAFDLIAKGFQRGLNRSGDFLQTINEYGIQFGSAGTSAAEFLGLLESGLEGGILGTDKAADLFKEFFIRIQDGSNTTAKGLMQLGLDSEAISAGLSNGTLTAADAFRQVSSAVNAIEDPILRSQAGVALFGTQFEDLGQSLGSIDLIPDSFEDIAGAADQLNAKYNNFGDMFAGIWRQAVVSVTPATDKLLELANDAMPFVEKGFDMLAEAIPPATDKLLELANDAMPFVEKGFDMLAEAIPPAIDFVVNAVDTSVNFIKNLFDGPLKEGLDGGIGAFETVQAWIDENMPLIQQTVETVLGAITGFWDEHGDTIMTVVDNFLSIVSTIFDTQLKNALDIVTAIMQLITGDFEGAEETILGIVDRTWESVLSIIGTMIENIQTVFKDVDWLELGKNIIQGIADGVGFAAHLLVEAVKASAGWALEGVKRLLGISSPSRVMADEVGGPIIAGLVQGITSNGRDVVSAAEAVINQTLAAMDFATNLDSQFGMFGDVFQGAQLEQYLANLATGISGNLSTLGALSLTGGDFEGAEETILGIVDRTWESVLSIIGTMIENIQTVFKDVDWLELGKNIIQGIADGVGFAAHLLVEAVKASAGWALEGVKRLLGISSPSRVMADEVGGPIIAGLVQGITSNGRDVVSAAEAVINQTLAAMDFATNLDSQFGMFGDVFQGAQLEQYLANLATGISGNLSTLGALSLTGGGFVDGGNNSGMGNGNNITINIYTNDASMAGDSVVQSLRAYGLAA